MTNKRIAQTNQQPKSDKPQESGILQRATVHSVADAGVQSRDDFSAQLLRNSVFSKDFSRVPINPTKPQQRMGKQMVSAVIQRVNGFESERQSEYQTVQPEDVSEASRVHKENKTGLPDHLKSGIENLSGISMDDVKVRYNSSKPSQLQALAYTQGTEIHVAPGQEKHLPHEAWHVVQQKQGRVKPTIVTKGVEINDDVELEKEAEEISSKLKTGWLGVEGIGRCKKGGTMARGPIQCFISHDFIRNYDGARDAWELAAREVRRYDNEINIAMRTHGWNQNNTTLKTLNNRVGEKSRKAFGTLAGEAYETHSWKVWQGQQGGTSVYGPGRGAGIDILQYQPGYGNASTQSTGRINVEVKTAQSMETLKDGLHDSGTISSGRDYRVYYHGQDVWKLGPGVFDTFQRQGRRYRVEIIGLQQAPEQGFINHARVVVYQGRTGNMLRSFTLWWS
ncbi:DUF4157 domain-containing protein [Nostoc sp. PCC 9305]|uniref:eCIS core domain-containing protein n=1 Tax=Nostoc sp. PCC 9305 TaxID=296636 RepID=UPI0039C5D1FF